MMTTFALVAGMLPVAIGVGVGGEFYRPLAVALIGGVLDKLYGNPVVTELGSRLLTRAGQSFVTGRTGRGVVLQPGEDPTTALQALPGWALRDAGHALQALADPLLPAALAVAAGAFALLVLRRRRGG